MRPATCVAMGDRVSAQRAIERTDSNESVSGRQRMNGARSTLQVGAGGRKWEGEWTTERERSGGAGGMLAHAAEWTSWKSA